MTIIILPYILGPFAISSFSHADQSERQACFRLVFFQSKSNSY